MTRRFLVAVSAAACIAVIAAPGVAVGGTLDQEQTAADITPEVSSLGSDAQTFTAGLTGGVDEIDLVLQEMESPTAPLTIQIRDTADGVPGSTILAATDLQASVVPRALAFFPIRFASPAPVKAGTQYAIVAYSDTHIPTGWYRWAAEDADVYRNGTFYNQPDIPPGLNWTAAPLDYTFKTYVVPPPTGSQAAALKQCKKKARKHDWSHKKVKKCKKKAKSLPV
jgi:hypothetical protein